MEECYKEKYTDYNIPFDEEAFLRWIGVIMRMSLFNLSNRDRYWI